VELRLGGKQAPGGNAVQPAGELSTLVPDFDGVSLAEAVQLNVGTSDFIGNPSMGAGGVGTSVNDLLKGGVNAGDEVIAGPPKRLGGDKAARLENTAVHRRPPH
jgi:hypothetical protein